VPYSLVLKAAIANSLGNRSLFGSNYQAYRTVKHREMQCHAEVIRRMVKKSRSANKQEALFTSAKSYANPVMMYMDIKVCFQLWRRYSQIYDDCDKDSVDIDSDDFQLSELETKKIKKKLVKQFTSSMAQIRGDKRRVSMASGGSNPLRKRTFVDATQPAERSSKRMVTKKGTILRGVGRTGTLDRTKSGSEEFLEGSGSRLGDSRPRKKISSVLPIIRDEDLEEASIDDSKQAIGDISRLD
jgi:hypothetical protein